MKFTNRSTQTDNKTSRRQFAIRVIGGALLLGLAFWIVDGLLSYYYFHTYLRFLIYTPPQTPLDAILFNLSAYTLFVRISFIIACLIGGIFTLGVLYRRMAADEALRDSETRYRRLVETMNDGLAVNDTQNRFTYVNERFCQMLGYSCDEILGQPAARFVLAEDHAKLKEESAARASGKHDVYELRMVRRNGDLIIVLLSPQPLYDAEGTFAGSFAIVTDITARQRAQEQELLLAVERERVKILEQLIADISHDFKTPLSTIRTSLHLLTRKVPPSDTYQRHLDALQSQTDHLTRMVDDLLRLSRLDAITELDFEAVNLNKLVELIVDELHDSAFKKQQTLDFISSASQIMVFGDRDQLYRAITNLVENAMRYTPENGMITIEARDDSQYVIVEVCDTGIGIGEDDLAHIFDRFYRSDRARNADQGGTGLGLAIAKKVIEMHAGRIEVESQLGQGSQFRIFLPKMPSS